MLAARIEDESMLTMWRSSGESYDYQRMSESRRVRYIHNSRSGRESVMVGVGDASSRVGRQRCEDPVLIAPLEDLTIL
jgi:hypothetical protein